MDLLKRARRLRGSDTLRRMVRETRMSRDALIYPVFVKVGSNIKEEITAMPGQYRWSVERLAEIFDAQLAAGVNKILFFGLPAAKDSEGSGGWRDDGIVQRALRWTKEHYPEIYCIGDVCMCEYTDHGHCGILKGRDVDNDATLDYLSRIALSQVAAGVDMVAPSDMMDGRVLAIRRALDAAGHETTTIMSYAAKFSSSFYGPFREAAGSAPSFGDRKTYQMDFHNGTEAMKEILQDIDEGADIVIVKPALSYLDIVRRAKDAVHVPVAAYNVSGEYALVKAAGAAGFVDEAALTGEIATSIFRAGADILITYFAAEIAGQITAGRIG
jgi:porphobilinogen synthase